MRIAVLLVLSSLVLASHEAAAGGTPPPTAVKPVGEPPKLAPPPKATPLSAVETTKPVSAGKEATKPSAATPPPTPPKPSAIPTTRFCPTSGNVAPLGPFGMKVNLGGMRGVVADDKSDVAEVAFTYRGPAANTKPLANGTVRRQIGVRLRAQDTCNAVYVMWHIEPDQKIGVSVKRNPGQSTHAQCLDNGYINLKPETEKPRTPIVSGAPKTLRAEIVGERIRVSTDGVVTWEGALPPQAKELTGPAGIRSDNGEFDFELRVPRGNPWKGTCVGVVKD